MRYNCNKEFNHRKDVGDNGFKKSDNRIRKSNH